METILRRRRKFFEIEIRFLKGEWRQFCAAGEKIDVKMGFLMGKWEQFCAAGDFFSWNLAGGN